MLRGVLVLAAAWALANPAAASVSTKCHNDNEKGPKHCNCTNQTVDAQMCTSSSVVVTNEQRGGGSLFGPGWKLDGSVSYSDSVSTGESLCLRFSLPPFTCAFYVYRFEVCVTSVKQEGLLFDSVKVSITYTYLGASLHIGPATEDDCSLD